MRQSELVSGYVALHSPNIDFWFWRRGEGYAQGHILVALARRKRGKWVYEITIFMGGFQQGLFESKLASGFCDNLPDAARKIEEATKAEESTPPF